MEVNKKNLLFACTIGYAYEFLHGFCPYVRSFEHSLKRHVELVVTA